MGDEDDLVNVYSTTSQSDVALIKMWLDAAGIRYITCNEVISAVYPVDGMAMVRFQVRRGDEALALEVLREHGFK